MSEARSYVDAWLAREPGMELARVFCPPPRRELFDLWGALLHQLDEAAFELRDAAVSRTKLAWWGEELATLPAQTARHPLVRALSAHEAARAVPAADWHALVHAAMLAGAGEHSPADVDALLAHAAPYARLTVRIEARVFEIGPAGAVPFDAATPITASQRTDNAPTLPAQPEQGAQHARNAQLAALAPLAQSAAVHQLLRRLEHSLGRDEARFPWPMNLRARHQAAPEAFAEVTTSPQAGAALADLAGELRRRAAGLRGGTLFRRCQAALDAQRLQRLERRRFEPLRANGIGTAWSLWRAARRGA